MTSEELLAWINRRYPSITAAAIDFGLTVAGLTHQTNGTRPVGKQTERIVRMIEEREKATCCDGGGRSQKEGK
jgi:hypothetical protein